MTLGEQLIDYIHAAFTGIYVQTHETDEAEQEILRLAADQGWQAARWDLIGGLRPSGNATVGSEGASDPLAVLRALPALAQTEGTTIVILQQFHRFLSSPEVCQALLTQLKAGKQQRVFVLILASVVQIPVELEKLFVVLEHQLPDRKQREHIARGLLSDQPDEMPAGEALVRILDASAGLTRYETEGAFALSLTRHNAIRPECIWELKAQTLRKSNLLTLHRGEERFDSLGGLDNLKNFCQRALQPGKPVKARGVLLLGLPGSGKSVFAKALGHETGRPTLLLDVGSLYGSLVGSTEANIRQALRIADAMAPCILFLDELEKGLSGVGSQGDSGVSTRLFGTILTWLAEHDSDVFFIGTANDISRLPPEFTRAERLDGVFFLEVPNLKEKDCIWKQYRHQFAIPDSQIRPDDSHWTGAEIKSCCRLAALLDITLTQAAHHVVPVAVTASEAVEKLRSWAHGRCLSASAPGIYQRPGAETSKPPRRIQRGPSNN